MGIRRPLPPAIEAFTAEADEWRALGFREPNVAMLDVGRAVKFGGYYLRSLQGTSNPAYMAELDEVEPRQIGRGRALELRSSYDTHWRKRPALAARLGELWRVGLLDGEKGKPVSGYRYIDLQNHPDHCCVVTVDTDGTLAVRVEDSAYALADDTPVDWHEYRLAPGAFFAEHEIHPRGGEPFIRQVISSSTVVDQVGNWLGRLQSVARSELEETG